MNYEEGSEYSIPDGDGFSETMLSEVDGGVGHGTRNLSQESIYEYGSRVGFWRLMRLFQERRIPINVLYREGASQPRMMSVGLHMRLAGRPGRIAGLERFLDHVQQHHDVWICRRLDIARHCHWYEHHPYPGRGGTGPA